MDLSTKIILAALILTLLIAVGLGAITHKQCKDVCDKKGAVTSQRIASGSWDTKDYCVCYFEDSVETIKLEEIS